jgi:hypothetical protein
MDDKVQVKLPTAVGEITSTRLQLDSDKPRPAQILVSGRFGDVDIERARTQIASLRTDVRCFVMSISIAILVKPEKNYCEYHSYGIILAIKYDTRAKYKNPERTISTW